MLICFALTVSTAMKSHTPFPAIAANSQSSHRVAISNNSISVHTFHFKYLKTFLNNRFVYLFCISKHVSQRDMESTYSKWRTSRRAGLRFVKFLRTRTTTNIARNHGFSGSHCGCLSWFRDLLQRPSVRNFVTIFLQKISFSPWNTRLQSGGNTVLQCKGKAIPEQVYYRPRGFSNFKTIGIWRW